MSKKDEIPSIMYYFIIIKSNWLYNNYTKNYISNNK